MGATNCANLGVFVIVAAAGAAGAATGTWVVLGGLPRFFVVFCFMVVGAFGASSTSNCILRSYYMILHDFRHDPHRSYSNRYRLRANSIFVINLFFSKLYGRMHSIHSSYVFHSVLLTSSFANRCAACDRS